MKKLFWRIVDVISTSSIFSMASKFFKLIRFDVFSRTFASYAVVARFCEVYGLKSKKLEYRFAAGMILSPIVYCVANTAFGAEVFVSVMILQFMIGFLLMSIITTQEVSRLYAHHMSVVVNHPSSFLTKRKFVFKEMRDILADPSLRTDRTRVLIRRDTTAARITIDTLERIGNQTMKKITKDLEDTKDIEANGTNHNHVWELLHESFPEIYNDIHTVFDPVYIQFEDQIIFFDNIDDYVSYLQLWMDSYPTHPTYFRKEEISDLVITDAGKLEKQTDEYDI